MLFPSPLLLTLFMTSWIFVIVIAEKRAIVSFMLRNKGGMKYKRMRELFLYSLRKSGYHDTIVFLCAGSGAFDTDDASLFQQYKVVTKSVSLINQDVGIIEKGAQVYEGTLSKLHLWGLTDYDQVLYFDNDFVFLKDPTSAFSACGRANLCATVDRLIADNGGQGYFNSGFLVLRPNADSFTNLVKNKVTHLDLPHLFVSLCPLTVVSDCLSCLLSVLIREWRMASISLTKISSMSISKGNGQSCLRPTITCTVTRLVCSSRLKNLKRLFTHLT